MSVPAVEPALVGVPLPKFVLLVTPGTDQVWEVACRDSGGAAVSGSLRMRVGPVRLAGELVDGVATLTLARGESTARLLGEDVLVEWVAGSGAVTAVARGTVREA